MKTARLLAGALVFLLLAGPLAAGNPTDAIEGLPAESKTVPSKGTLEALPVILKRADKEVGEICRAREAETCARAQKTMETARELDPKVVELERKVEALETAVSAAGVPVPAEAAQTFAKAVGTLAEEGGGLYERHLGNSLEIDHLGSPLWDKSIAIREVANQTAVRLGAIRDRLAALQKKLGVPVTLSGAPEKVSPDDPRAKSHELKAGLPSVESLWPMRGSERLIGGSGAPSLLNLPREERTTPATGGRSLSLTVSPPPGPVQVRPDSERVADMAGCGLSSKHGGWKDSSAAMAAEAKQAETARAAHERGDSVTAGDPQGRAALVHPQSGQTCSIAAQLQILRAYGAAPPGTPEQQENALYAEAVKKGYFKGSRGSGGTPWQFAGDLLQDHGLIVTKHMRSKDSELVAAAAKGKMLLVQVSCDKLWYNRNFRGANHTIVVTGVELDAKDKTKAVGFFINDSDDGVYGAAGRFVPAENFLKAWHAIGSQFIEVQ